MITNDQLHKLCDPIQDHVNEYYPALVAAMTKYNITTNKQIASFLGQVIVESDFFRAVHENLNYSAARLVQVWPARFNAQNAATYAHNPEAIANHAYANKYGNGDEHSGDGFRYRGRGLIQITFKANYQEAAKSFNKTVEETAVYMETPEGACMSAAWFWDKHKLNTLAETLDVAAITKIINGGSNGLAYRTKYTTIAVALLA